MKLLAQVLLLAALLWVASARTSHKAAVSTSTKAKSFTGSIYTTEQGGYSFKPGVIDKKAVAWGIYQDKRFTAGVGEVAIETNPDYADEKQAYAAGFLEGALTHGVIYQFYSIVYEQNSHPSYYTYFQEHDEYVREKLAAMDLSGNSASANYWFQVKLLLKQMEGLLAGFNSQVPDTKHLKLMDLWLTNSECDIFDLERALTPGRKFKRVEEMSHTEFMELMTFHNRCSALIKYTGDDLLVSHATWEEYSEMVRMYKHYHLNFNHPGVKVRRVSFSGYPSVISSTDDWYLLDSGLVVTETTFNLVDESLYDYITSQGVVMSWMRAMIANRLSTDAQSWARHFEMHNSGTYNNQWMIIDYNKFTPGQRLKPNTVLLLEQLPNKVSSRDISKLLNEKKYFASYNYPMILVEEAGFKRMEVVHGDLAVPEKCSRHRLFDREQAKITNLASMKDVMLSNNYLDPNDEITGGCPGHAIAARFDLKPAGNCIEPIRASGAVDCKVTNYKMSKSMSAELITGPTTWHGLTPFSWDNVMFADETHIGQPTTWDFDWIEVKPPKFTQSA